MVPATFRSQTGFDCLDDNWAVLCRHYRNGDRLREWAQTEPTLAGIECLEHVVPPPGHDRFLPFGAIARITATGDHLAARVLLQLLIPGLVRIARDLEGGRLDDCTSGDVISAAWCYIERLRVGDLYWWAPTYLLRSVRRDLLARRVRERTRTFAESYPSHVDIQGQCMGSPSAEAVALERSGARSLLANAVRGGTISATAAELLWLCIVGDRPVTSAAATLGLPLSTAYRVRRQAVSQLRRALAPTSAVQRSVGRT